MNVLTDLFHALRRNTGKNGPEKASPSTGTSQTDRTKTGTSGDGGERPSFDFKAVKDVDDATVEAFFAATHEGSRRMPLLVAQWVYALLEDELTTPGRMDERRLVEIRGGMMALRRFGVAYQGGIDEWKRRNGRRSPASGGGDA
ncbi:MAG: hypothetical protein IJ829_08460 [Kiritimatiellae bacterium]|nr:hypothetical protein [Kiritimatiellia bacterium]